MRINGGIRRILNTRLCSKIFVFFNNTRKAVGAGQRMRESEPNFTCRIQCKIRYGSTHIRQKRRSTNSLCSAAFCKMNATQPLAEEPARGCGKNADFFA